MRAFSCPACGALIHFENSQCLRCGAALGFARPLADFVVAGPDTRCVQAALAACNWVRDPADAEGRCPCCALTRTRPADHDGAALTAFARAQAALRRLLYQLDDLRLPVIGRAADPRNGLAFDLLSSAQERVITGHAHGVITLDLAEGDDGHREALRVRLAEPYRTLLGHVRHEIGHWYWTLLVENRPEIEDFRATFGDERVDYPAALHTHYATDPRAGWEQSHVSIYATAHPWEDWAETFAHYLHIRDSLQTAAAFGVVVTGPVVNTPPSAAAPLSSVPLEAMDDLDMLVDTWLPLTYALNAVNRSMGKDDLYPFVLSPRVQNKLRLVHRLIKAPRVGEEGAVGQVTAVSATKEPLAV
ncbi:MAG: zinc-binding metallopeptidase family protein [Sporichthyaceae bacterium]